MKKWHLTCLILIIVGIFFINIPRKPKLVSSITTLDTAYLTILVDKKEMKDRLKLEEKIITMCKENTFENMKLWTDERNMASKWYISIYSSEKDLREGKECLTIKYEEGE